MDEKIEAVARALCTFDGKDPDQNTELRRSPGFHPGSDAPSTAHVPLWRSYRQEAERFVVAAEALQPILRRVDVGRW